MKKKIVLSGGSSRPILAVAGRMRQRVSPLLAIALLMLAGSLPVSAQTQDLIKYANTLQGTQSDFGLSYGNVNPVISLPFGMNAWSAQTGKDGDGWKYQYQARTIRAFGQSHQCSPWMGDYGVFTLMPVLDSVKTNEDQRALGFSHADETAQPSYYGRNDAYGAGNKDAFFLPQRKSILSHAGWIYQTQPGKN
jgi:putative alpha-1,2-mannosidase